VSPAKLKAAAACDFATANDVPCWQRLATKVQGSWCCRSLELVDNHRQREQQQNSGEEEVKQGGKG
jgi:hypothetical protein